MAVDFDAFVDWCMDRFDGDVIVKGKEVKLNSIFAEDSKHHLWANPYGGIHDREDGCYRCFYTETWGTLVGLVMHVDGCSYKEAKDILSGLTPLRALEAELDEFYTEREKVKDTPVLKAALDLPDYTWPIKTMPAASLQKMDAEYYLEKRKIPIANLCLCTAGDYRNRIVIPYYDRNGKLIYWNSRALSDEGLRYQGPPKTCGVGKGDVIYMTSWPKPGSKIYVTEGEFDAMSLNVCGLNGAACGGRTMSDAQVLMLKDYHICLTLDTDEAGYQGLLSMSQKLMRNGISRITYVRPPVGYKDWNTMLVKHDEKIMLAYIEKKEKLFDDWTAMNLEMTH